jgi:hypothetical protein
MPKHDKNHIELLKTWVLPPAATLGSSVRMKGILLEIRAGSACHEEVAQSRWSRAHAYDARKREG